MENIDVTNDPNKKLFYATLDDMYTVTWNKKIKLNLRIC